MTLSKLEKIRALATDPRGDPATREIAKQTLKRFGADPEWRDERVAGLKTSADYDRNRFLDVSAWKKTTSGNRVHDILWKGRPFRVVLFRYKKANGWGWLRIDTFRDRREFSKRFETIAEAHAAAWTSLKSM